MSKEAAEKTAAAQADAARNTGLALDAPGIRPLRSPPVPEPEPEPEPSGKTSVKGGLIDAFRRLRGTSMGATIGYTIGFMFPPLGMVVGAALGDTAGYITEAEQLGNAERRTRKTAAKELSGRVLRSQKREAAHR